MLNNPKIRDKIIQMIGLTSILLGSLTIVGYLTNNPELHTWRMGKSMPLNTAIGFVGIGIAVFLIGRRLCGIDTPKDKPPYSAPNDKTANK